jgi:C4-dicarboxylate transporter, DctQ subunit
MQVGYSARQNVVSSITAAYNGLINGLRYLAGVVIFGIFVLIVADVFVRLIGISPWLYSYILVEYGLLWFAMLGAPQLVRTKGHVFIDAITQLMPQGVRRVTARIAYVICVVSSLIFSYYSLQLLIGAIADNEIDVRAVDMPLWTLLSPLPFCFALVAIEFLRYLVGWDSMYGERIEVKENV